MPTAVTAEKKKNHSSGLCGADMKGDHTVCVSAYLFSSSSYECIICMFVLYFKYCEGANSENEMLINRLCLLIIKHIKIKITSGNRL